MHDDVDDRPVPIEGSGQRETEAEARFFESPPPANDDELPPAPRRLGLRVGGALLLINAAILLVDTALVPQADSPNAFCPAFFDVLLGGALLAGQERWRALVLFRCAAGAVVYGLLHLARGDGLFLIFQALVTASLLTALIGEAGRLRVALAILLYLPYAGLELFGLATLTTQSEHASLDLEPGDAGLVIGELRPWQLVGAPGWRSRRSAAARQDNPLADRWISFPGADAHLIVIVEDLEPGSVLDQDAFADAVIANSQEGLDATLVERTTLGDGSTLLHLRGTTGLVRIEQLVRCVVRRDAAYQVVGYSSSALFARSESDLRAMIASFRAP